MRKSILTALFLSLTLAASAGVTDKAMQKVMPVKHQAEKVGYRPAAVPNYASVGTNKLTQPLNGVADEESMVYAFMPYDLERFTWTNSFIKFSTDFPHENYFYKIADFDTRRGPDYPEIAAGTFIGDDYVGFLMAPYDLAYWETMGLYKIDLEDGSYSLYRDCGWFKDKNLYHPIDMSYDPTTGLLWYVSPITTNPIQFYGAYDEDCQGCALFYVDMNAEKPYPVQVRQMFDEFFICNITADHGVIYALADEVLGGGIVTSFLKLTPNASKTSFEVETIREYNSNEIVVDAPGDFSSMEMDRNNRRLYASFTNLDSDESYSVVWVEIDMKTGAILSKEQQGVQIMVDALAMPYQFCPDNAPGYPRNFTVTCAPDGSAEATLTWLKPNVNYMQQPLIELSGYEIYRDDKLIATLDGDATEYVDKDCGFGEFVYTIVPFNTAGKGIDRSRQSYVGTDVPGYPIDVLVSAFEDTATLTWSAPVVGAHNAYFEPVGITYNVVRNPGNVLVADHTTATKITDKVDEVQGYTYTVTPFNAVGEGLSYTTKLIAFGPAAAVPFHSDLQTVEAFNTWEVWDENHDGFKWQYSDAFKAAIYDATFCSNTPNDMIVSPLIDTKAGHQYKLTYNVKVHNYRDTEEKFEWYAGPADADPEWKGDLFDAGTYDAYQSLVWHTRQATFGCDEDGTRLIFVVRSNPLQGILYLGDMTLREYTDTDLAVLAVEGSELAGEGIPTAIRVTVKNEGKSTVSKYSIRVWDEETNNSVTQEFTEPISSEDSKVCLVNWTPNNIGTYRMHAEVILEGDTYPQDNRYDGYHQIKITEAGEVNWLSIATWKKSDSNWCGVNFPYTESQALYLKEELNLAAGTEIVGIGFAYDGNDALLDLGAVDFRVDMGNSDLVCLYSFADYANDWNYYPNLQPSSSFQKTVFEDRTEFNVGAGQIGNLMFDFDEPFVYDGRNLLVRIIRLESSRLADSYIQFHFDVLDATSDGSINPNARAIYCEADATVAEGSFCKGHGLNQLPVLYLGYTLASGIEGIKSVAGQLVADSHDGRISLSKTCSAVELTDLSGRVLYTGANVSEISTDLTSGVYLINATLADGAKTSFKVQVK